MEQHLFPIVNEQYERTQPNSYRLGEGQHELPFEFKLPFSSECDNEEHEPTVLPPTVYLRMLMQDKIQVSYTLCVDVVKGHNRLLSGPHRKQFSKEIKFRGLESLNPRFDGSEIRGTVTSMLSCAPMEVTLNAYLRPGNTHSFGEPITLEIQVLREVDPAPSHDIILTSITMELQPHIRVMSRAIYRVHSDMNTVKFFHKGELWQTIFLADSKDEETFIDPHIWWDEAFVPKVTDSFETCNIGFDYSLILTCGIKYGPDDANVHAMHLLTLANPVSGYNYSSPTFQYVIWNWVICGFGWKIDCNAR